MSSTLETRTTLDVRMGDIGEEQEEIEYEPLSVPAVEPVEIPAEPEPVLVP